MHEHIINVILTEHFSLKLRILQDPFDLVEASVGSKRSVVQKKSVDLAKYSGKALLLRLRWIQRLNQKIRRNSNSKYVSKTRVLSVVI